MNPQPLQMVVQCAPHPDSPSEIAHLTIALGPIRCDVLIPWINLPGMLASIQGAYDKRPKLTLVKGNLP